MMCMHCSGVTLRVHVAQMRLLGVSPQLLIFNGHGRHAGRQMGAEARYARLLMWRQGLMLRGVRGRGARALLLGPRWLGVP